MQTHGLPGTPEGHSIGDSKGYGFPQPVPVPEPAPPPVDSSPRREFTGWDAAWRIPRGESPRIPGFFWLWVCRANWSSAVDRVGPLSLSMEEAHPKGPAGHWHFIQQRIEQQLEEGRWAQIVRQLQDVWLRLDSLASMRAVAWAAMSAVSMLRPEGPGAQKDTRR